jgi:hypothetical protein
MTQRSSCIGFPADIPAARDLPKGPEEVVASPGP